MHLQTEQRPQIRNFWYEYIVTRGYTGRFLSMTGVRIINHFLDEMILKNLVPYEFALPPQDSFRLHLHAYRTRLHRTRVEEMV